MIFAGADRRSYRTEQRRRARDLAFIERVRSASLDDLLVMQAEHQHGAAWKLVAIERMIRKAEAR